MSDVTIDAEAWSKVRSWAAQRGSSIERVTLEIEEYLDDSVPGGSELLYSLRLHGIRTSGRKNASKTIGNASSAPTVEEAIANANRLISGYESDGGGW